MAHVETEGPHLKTTELAKAWGANEKTIRNLIKNRKLGAIRMGRSFRVPRSEANSFLDRNAQPALVG